MMESLIREMLQQLGEDPNRPGLSRTPSRVAAAWKDLTSGYGMDPVGLLECATFEEESAGMVVCRDVRFVSTCEHHMLPFFGEATIAYLSSGRLVGISKLARITDAFARRLQVQERMGQQLLDTVEQVLRPRGVLVHISALHLCMMARGVKQENAKMVTLHTSGEFSDRPELVGSVWAGGR